MLPGTQRVVAVQTQEQTPVNSRTIRTGIYGVNVPFMSFYVHGWDIHAVSTRPYRAAV